MKTKLKFILPIVFTILVIVVFLVVLVSQNPALLDPQGVVAEKQRNLLIFTTALGVFVLLPVFVLTFFIVWRYRDGNTKARYRPEWDGNTKLETIWWGIPCLIILVLGVVTWNSSHDLDPYKPLVSETTPVRVQVVALPWKWLFIYPDYNVASVNFMQFPEDTPVNFEITADAPMNSFWIPQLGGQVYAMAGMTTKLHLMADQPGSYAGTSANLSGDGFAGMRFVAKASTQADYETWLAKVRKSKSVLTMESYEKLAQPSKDDPAAFYAVDDPDLYDKVIGKYMSHGHGGTRH
jgi:cytochrome o ubiquinol oxidase subunit II